MPSTYSDIKIELMTQGDKNNQWGNITNTNLGTAMEQAMVGMATISSGFTTNVATLTLTNTNALQDARALCLNVTATLTAAGTLNVPAIQKPYIVFNNTSGGFALTVKVSGQTGVSVPNGKKTVLYNNGTDVGEQINYLSGLTLGAALGAASGGTGLTASGTAGNVLTSNGTGWTSSTPTTGTVSTVSVVSANGLAGTVATATTTPAITLSTTITGVLKGNGTAISAATAGTDYVAPGTATTFTAKQTFTGAATAIGVSLQAVLEKVNVSATAATGTVAFNINTAVVWYYTTNASGNWTINIRGDASNSLNSLMAVGESMTCAFLVTQGSTAYYNSAVQVDGTTSGVTTKWQGGTAPAAGNASGIDVYTYTVVKTASATFTVLAALTQFK